MQVQMNIPKIKDRLEDSLLVAHVAQQANHLKQPCCFKLKHMADQVWRQNSLEDSIYHYPQVSISYKQFFFHKNAFIFRKICPENSSSESVLRQVQSRVNNPK
jgi:hypothetical protein